MFRAAFSEEAEESEVANGRNLISYPWSAERAKNGKEVLSEILANKSAMPADLDWRREKVIAKPFH